MNIFRQFSVMLDTVLSFLNLVLRNNRNAIFPIMVHFVLFSVEFNFEGKWRLDFLRNFTTTLNFILSSLDLFARDTGNGMFWNIYFVEYYFRIFGTMINVRTTDLSSLFKHTTRCNLYVYYSIIRHYAGRLIF